MLTTESFEFVIWTLIPLSVLLVNAPLPSNAEAQAPASGFQRGFFVAQHHRWQAYYPGYRYDGGPDDFRVDVSLRKPVRDGPRLRARGRTDDRPRCGEGLRGRGWRSRGLASSRLQGASKGQGTECPLQTSFGDTHPNHLRDLIDQGKCLSDFVSSAVFLPSPVAP